MVKKKDIIIHKIEGTDREWLEYPKEVYISESFDHKGYDLVVTNKLRNQPQLVREIIALYKNEVDISEKWFRVEQFYRDNSLATKIDKCNGDNPPIVKDEFTHSLIISGRDKNMLEFIKWDIEKKLATRETLASVDIKEDVEEKNSPSFTLDVNPVQPAIVDIPRFLKDNEVKGRALSRRPARRKVDNFDKSIPEIFEDMEHLIDSFFDNWKNI